jgi:hypothetical protein
VNTIANPADRTAALNSLVTVGKERFDTKLVRNLTWFVQLQRILRVVLVNHLSWLDTPVVRGLKIADGNITEYNADQKDGNPPFDGTDYEVV